MTKDRQPLELSSMPMTNIFINIEKCGRAARLASTSFSAFDDTARKANVVLFHSDWHVPSSWFCNPHDMYWYMMAEYRRRRGSEGLRVWRRRYMRMRGRSHRARRGY